MEKASYPLKFEPLASRPAWSGTLLAEYLGRGQATNDLLGESVELIDHGPTQSLVANGPLRGTALRDLVADQSHHLVSNRHHPDQPFPLHVKYLAPGRRLPLMVHADELTGDPLGIRPNAKMWYVIAANHGAQLYVGIKPRYTQQQFLNHLGSPDLEDILQSFPAEPGDAYYLTAGRPHTLSQGNLILAIEHGPIPPLIVNRWSPDEPEPTASQLQQALAAIHFQDRSIARIRCESSTVQRNRKLPLVNLCPQFSVDELRLIQPMHERTDGSTFHHLVAIDGPVDVTLGRQTASLAPGESCLIPAAPGYYILAPTGDRLTKVIKTTLRT